MAHLNCAYSGCRVIARWAAAAAGTRGFGFDRSVLLCLGRFGVERWRCLVHWHRLPRASRHTYLPLRLDHRREYRIIVAPRMRRELSSTLCVRT